MRFFVLFFLLCQVNCHKAESQPSGKPHFAILVKLGFKGELAFAHRIKAAADNLQWDAEIIDLKKRSEIKKKEYDFVIMFAPCPYTFPKCNNYLAIFHPWHHFFNKEMAFIKKYGNRDGYLLTYKPGATDPNFGSSQSRPFMNWYPTVQKREYQRLNPSKLFFICPIWGDRRDDAKYKNLFSMLEQESYSRFYGTELFASTYPKAYVGPIPYDTHSLHETMQDAGVTLVLHSNLHNAVGIPSGRIFEAAAASTVIISDENAFVQENFGDSVLYINTEKEAESIFNQIQQHMLWIQENPNEALAMAKKSHAIFQENFLLENQLLQLEKFHNEQIQTPKGRLIRMWRWVKKKTKAFFSLTPLHAEVPNFDPTPIAVLPNTNANYSLINSVDFHPQENLACVTFTQNNQVILYKVDDSVESFQVLTNPKAKLQEPQHAAFSPDGKLLAVANWTDQMLNFYERNEDGFFQEAPIFVIPPPQKLNNHKPHGIAFSPCGQYLAVAYGAAKHHGRGIALLHIQTQQSEIIQCTDTPKGIAFSPDGTSLLVTFADTDCLKIFDLVEHSINPIPKQILKGIETKISRPEDVKVSPDGTYCALSNSGRNTVTFYPFDSDKNIILQSSPSFTLKNPETGLIFPHGIAFSADGSMLAITQFGPVQVSWNGSIVWDAHTLPGIAKLNLYKLKNEPIPSS